MISLVGSVFHLTDKPDRPVVTGPRDSVRGQGTAGHGAWCALAWVAAILANARSVWDHDTNANHRFGLRWTGPFDRADAAWRIRSAA
jgi:hypothetical protein